MTGNKIMMSKAVETTSLTLQGIDPADENGVECGECQEKELVVLAPGEWLSNLVYCCDNRWRPNHVVTHGHKTQHVFDMDENNSVGITTSENSWNRACHVSSYYSILFGCWTIYPK